MVDYTGFLSEAIMTHHDSLHQGRGLRRHAAAILFFTITAGFASVDTVRFPTAPALTPAFSTMVSDSVVRLTSGAQVQVAVTNTDASDTTTIVSMDGQSPETGSCSTQVSLNARQDLKITATQGATAMDYCVRSLPSGCSALRIMERAGVTPFPALRSPLDCPFGTEWFRRFSGS